MKEIQFALPVKDGKFFKAYPLLESSGIPDLENNYKGVVIDRPTRIKAIEANVYLYSDQSGLPNTWKLSNISIPKKPFDKQDLKSFKEIVKDYTNSHTDKTSTEYKRMPKNKNVTIVADSSISNEQVELMNFINSCNKLKPKSLIMSNLKWKYLVRSAKRGKNIMMTGPAGAGKTMAVYKLVDALQHPYFYFNLGATQDPRATLIGNTHFNSATGTYFSESPFIKAIQTENAIILMDELSRAHPEAWNILMTVLDQNQRYLRLDEKDGSPIIKVAKGVSFIATANIGNEFTSTRTLDRALLDRFTIIEMDQLSKSEEAKLLHMKFPTVDDQLISAIAEIAAITRTEFKSENSKISTAISTRMNEEVASLIQDGFSLPEAAEVGIFPFFSSDGGADSERTYIKQLVQKYCPAETAIDETDSIAIPAAELPPPF